MSSYNTCMPLLVLVIGIALRNSGGNVSLVNAAVENIYTVWLIYINEFVSLQQRNSFVIPYSHFADLNSKVKILAVQTVRKITQS